MSLLCMFISIFVYLLSPQPNISSLNDTEGLFVNMKAVCDEHGFFFLHSF